MSFVHLCHINDWLYNIEFVGVRISVVDSLFIDVELIYKIEQSNDEMDEKDRL